MLKKSRLANFAWFLIFCGLMITLVAVLFGNPPTPTTHEPELKQSVLKPTRDAIEKPIQYKEPSRGKSYREIAFETTAYTSVECGSKKTASGRIIDQDIYCSDGIIAAPPEIPYGTKMYVEGWGFGTVYDRGGSIKGDRLDLYFDDYGKAVQWGRRRVMVRIYE